ncbi:uncharacterized protein LOC108603314 [Drosophila busckii]|uniref:uncharacterized protein LOC108603314 n=1 Tax=Drosophila busckii TaxID=30019 RepID=UPI001432EAB9|nr:uncharacterized protein LOC108603314 [Drosophila busckii]
MNKNQEGQETYFEENVAKVCDEENSSTKFADMELAEQTKPMESIFGSADFDSLQEKLLEMSLTPVESATEAAEEQPIIPDFDIDYDDIYEDAAKLDSIEKQLELIYRPFIVFVTVDCHFSLSELSALLDDSRYEPTHYPAVFLHLREFTAEVKLYACGQIVARALTEQSASDAVLQTIRLLHELDYKLDITDYCKNIVTASFCLPFKIDLEMLGEMHGEMVSANRELRPFATYKIEGSAIRFAIFPNGYVLALHSLHHGETRAAIAGILPILVQFKNGFLTPSEKLGSLCGGDVNFKLLWEYKLNADKFGQLLYS